MPDLERELTHLQLADTHIAQAERGIADMEAVLDWQRESGADTQPSEEALAAARNGLEAFREHRRLIAAIIDDIESGRLPRS
jgi:hypothetical protein